MQKHIIHLSVLLILSCVLAIPLHSASRVAVPQGTEGSLGIPCTNTATDAEKLICSDREFIALDLEYSRVVAARLQDTEGLERDAIRNAAKDLIPFRDKCVNDNDNPANSAPRSMQLLCLQKWYYGRIAELSDVPEAPPSEWTPRLVAGVPVFVSKYRGLNRTQTQKPIADVYARAASAEKVFKMSFEEGKPQPARLDRSVLYYVYRNVLGSLTYVQEYRNDGHLDLGYFFNKDGHLAAETRSANLKMGDVLYVEAQSAFYNSAGRETTRTRIAYEDGRIAKPLEQSSLPPFEKPAFNSFTGFFDKQFSAARGLDAGQLGLCYVWLSDGYGPQTRVLNVAAEPLSYYQHTIPAMNYGSMSKPLRAEGTVRQLGALAGKRVYDVDYSGATHVILVERARDRFLPVPIVSTDEPIDILKVENIEGQGLLVYSSTISGNAHYVDDWYFIVERGVPKRIQYDTALQSELTKIRPEEVKMHNRAGQMDPKTLTYREYVAPCGDYVEILFGMRDGAFYVKSSLYNKED